jgi:hypothetical protein
MSAPSQPAYLRDGEGNERHVTRQAGQQPGSPGAGHQDRCPRHRRAAQGHRRGREGDPREAMTEHQENAMQTIITLYRGGYLSIAHLAIRLELAATS